MQCPRCQHENPTGTTFCGECAPHRSGTDFGHSTGRGGIGALGSWPTARSSSWPIPAPRRSPATLSWTAT